MLELNKQESWEKEFDKTFELTDPVPVWTTNEGKGYGKTTLGNVVKNFIRSQRQQAQKEVLEELEKQLPQFSIWVWGLSPHNFEQGKNIKFKEGLKSFVNQLKGE